MVNDEVFLTPQDIAKRWNCSPKTVIRRAKDYKKVLRPIPLSRQWRFSFADVQKFEEQMRSMV